MSLDEKKLYKYLFDNPIGSMKDLRNQVNNDSLLDMLFILGILAKGAGLEDTGSSIEIQDQYRVTEFGDSQIRLKYSLSLIQF